MITRRLKWWSHVTFTLLMAGLFLSIPISGAQEKDKPDVSKIPAKVKDALMARFPAAEIQKWTREKEGDIFVHDIEFTQDGQKLEADIKEDGTIHNWEREVSTRTLPVAVKKVVEKMYPRANLGQAMMITAVVDGNDVLEGYEIALETIDKKEVEVMVSPDGRILEDSGKKE